MMQPPFRIVQISDTHVCADKNRDLLGVKTYDSFTAVVDLVHKDAKRPDLILLTGDLSQDESRESYLYVAEKIKALAAPAYWIPGNHDNVKMMEQVFPLETISNQKHIILEQWQIILLNSQKPDCVEGYLNQTQLSFLRNCLDQYPQHQAIIVFHHHPAAVGSAWLDKIGLTNADELWSLLADYPNVNILLFGHVHQEHQGEQRGIKYYSTPSTCFQFKRNSAEFSLEKLNAGYRWIDLFADGEFKTGINRVQEYIGRFEEKAKGY